MLKDATVRSASGAGACDAAPDATVRNAVQTYADEILGEPCYPTLADLPVVPDLVDVFRRSDDLPEVAEETIAIGAKAFWAQLGLWNVDAAQMANEAGLDVVMDRCLKIEHARFHGGLHRAGFDTGVIDSRRWHP